MEEIKTNLHIHTSFSDGSKTHQEVIRIAIENGIQALIFTDHNIFPEGIEGYHRINGKDLLVIMGEEIHNPNLFPQKNHLLALGTGKSLAHFATDRGALISQIHASNGAAFLAHPYDPALPDFNEPDISWEDWGISGYDGIELWNGFSELKVRSKSKFHTYFYAFFPRFLPHSPPQETSNIWNRLHSEGKKIAAIAGADAHALAMSAGPISKTIYPYSYHFSALNNHVLLKDGLTGDFQKDRNRLISALAKGQNYISNDLIRNANGFRFNLKTSRDQIFQMGDSIPFEPGLTGEVVVPGNADVRWIRDGAIVEQVHSSGKLNFPVDTAGVYRVECCRKSRFRRRTWIISNPIYVY